VAELKAELKDVHRAIVSCELCPRLRTYCQRVAREKRRAFRADTYWAKPVPGFGDPMARVLIVGLAPAAHGANRTGRVFTGDGVGGSGDFLMAALHRAGFANISTSQHPGDGLTIRDAFITTAVRVRRRTTSPPEEIGRCRASAAELEALPRAVVVVALGKIAFDAYCAARAAGYRCDPSEFGPGLRISYRTVRCYSAAITRAVRIRIRGN
jgi:uracil-DNA glycosylase